MKWVAAGRERLRALLFGARADAEMDAELRFHLEQEAKLLREAGLGPREARRQAKLRFGGVERVREEVREARGVRVFEDLVKDARYGARMLRKRQGFTVVAVVSLAIGIGANTAIFSLVNATILRDVPVDRPEELVNVYSASPSDLYGTLSYPNYADLRDGTRDVFSAIGAARNTNARIDRDGGVEIVPASAVTGDYLSLVGVEAQRGRAIGPADDIAPGGHPVVMLTHGYWQRGFGGDPTVVGSELRLSGGVYTIVGIAAAVERSGSLYPRAALYVPMSMHDEVAGLEGQWRLDWWQGPAGPRGDPGRG
ncbi:MAG: ABC transporter permease [Vicinamibacterales bacterium]|jgi:hypothetical protein|nr:ABC transporter permease [Vicinamibacterales bacterium]